MLRGPQKTAFQGLQSKGKVDGQWQQ